MLGVKFLMPLGMGFIFLLKQRDDKLITTNVIKVKTILAFYAAGSGAGLVNR
jgi:hypothetical protein